MTAPGVCLHAVPERERGNVTGCRDNPVRDGEMSSMRQRRPVTLALALALLALPAMAAQTLELWGLTPLHKVTPTESPGTGWQSSGARMECARNEWEAVQVVVRASESVQGLSVNLSELRGPRGRVLPFSRMRLCKAEWVDVNAPFDPDAPSTEPDLQPDPLPRVNPAVDRFNLKPGHNLVFWIMVGVPADTPPGLYEGRFDVRPPEGTATGISISLRVRNFALPKRPILQSMVGLSAGNIYKAHGCRTPAQREAVIRLYFEEYIRARLSPFLYATGTMAFNPLPDGRIGWTFERGPDGRPTGEVTMDFAGFDREAEVYLGERDAFSSFNVAPYIWTRKREKGHTDIALRFADSANTVVTRLAADGSVDPVFDKLVVAVFRAIAAHLDQRGWLDRAVYYVTDEPAEEETPVLKQICTLVRQADARLRTALTYDPANRPRLAELVDDDGRSLISLWIPYCSLYREKVANEQRAKGAEYWLYDVKETCLIPHTGMQNRGMFWTVWHCNAKGYLYYLSTYWGRDATPWDRPSFLLPGVSYQYRQGDGYFFYPPQRLYNPDPPVLDTVVTTVRWELMREGAEDYDTLRLLEGLTEQAQRRNLPVAKAGRDALALARAMAQSTVASAGGANIAQLQFAAREEAAGAIPGTGWTFNAKEGWLHHPGGKRADLPMLFEADVPDGKYELVTNVYADTDYRGRKYSRFLVNGRPLRTPSSSLKGPVNVNAGTVEVEAGVCRFVLSAVEQDRGVILYRVALRRAAADATVGLYTVRTRLADTIEEIQAALGSGR